MEKKATIGRIILLVIIFILIWCLLITKFNKEMEELDKINATKSTSTNNDELKYVNAQTSTPVETTGNQNQIVTDRHIVDLDNSDYLIIKTDGKYYEVKEGSFIIGSKVININENTKSIEFLDSPRRTVTSN